MSTAFPDNTFVVQVYLEIEFIDADTGATLQRYVAVDGIQPPIPAPREKVYLDAEGHEGSFRVVDRVLSYSVAQHEDGTGTVWSYHTRAYVRREDF